MILRKVFTDRLFDGFSFQRWNERLLHRAEVVAIEGRSYRDPFGDKS